MPTLGLNGKITLTDWTTSIDPDGSAASVAELLTIQNPILNYLPFLEGNLPTGHQSTVRTGLPTPTWRRMYQGVQPSKSTRMQVVDTCGMLEARNEVDAALVRLNGNEGAFMLQEATAQLEGMNQAFASTLFYGDTSVNPERFTGLTPRYNVLTGAPVAQNVINAGGTAGNNQTSIWLVVLGPSTIHGIFPKGSVAGLQREDLGTIDAFDTQTPPARFRARAERFEWNCGLVVRDWRFAVRICNIQIANLLATSGFPDIAKLMVRAMARIPSMGMGTPLFLCSRAVYTAACIQALDKSQQALAIQPALQQYGQISPGSAGTGTLTFLGVPVLPNDSLLDTESALP